MTNSPSSITKWRSREESDGKSHQIEIVHSFYKSVVEIGFRWAENDWEKKRREKILWLPSPACALPGHRTHPSRWHGCKTPARQIRRWWGNGRWNIPRHIRNSTRQQSWKANFLDRTLRPLSRVLPAPRIDRFLRYSWKRPSTLAQTPPFCHALRRRQWCLLGGRDLFMRLRFNCNKNKKDKG